MNVFTNVFLEILLKVSTILGLAASIIGLVFSYKSWKNTKGIYRILKLEKIKDKYRSRHPEFVLRLKSALLELRNGKQDNNFIVEIYQICVEIYMLSDGWPESEIDELYKFMGYLDSIIKNNMIFQKELIQVQIGIVDLLASLERISVLEKIDEPISNSD